MLDNSFITTYSAKPRQDRSVKIIYARAYESSLTGGFAGGVAGRPAAKFLKRFALYDSINWPLSRLVPRFCI